MLVCRQKARKKNIHTVSTHALPVILCSKSRSTFKLFFNWRSSKLFPKKLNIAKIVNIYRPISVLVIFSKILGKLMYQMLSNYPNVNNIMADNQHGFREGHFTYIALLRMINASIYKLGNIFMWIFINLTKACCIVDQILLIKNWISMV